MKKIILFIILLVICFIVVYLLINPVFAQVMFKPQIGIDEKFEAGVAKEVEPWTFAEYLITFYKWSVRAIAILAVVMIMVAGFKWMTAAGNAPAIAQAKDQMISAIIGLILVLGANLLLGFINPALTRLKSLEITKIERKELTMWEFPVPLNKREWYEPDKEPYPGARKCGNGKRFEEDGKKIVRYGTECDDGEVCDLKFSITEKDYLDWKEGRTEEDISRLIHKDSAKCIKVYWGLTCDPPIVSGCAQIELANEEKTGLKKYPLVTGATFTGARPWSCGEKIQDTFFIFGRSPTRWETACGGGKQKGCVFVTIKQIYNDGSYAYVSDSRCNWYPPSLKSCKLTETRVSCDKCNNHPECTNGFDDGKICCAEYGVGPYHLR